MLGKGFELKKTELTRHAGQVWPGWLSRAVPRARETRGEGRAAVCAQIHVPIGKLGERREGQAYILYL